MTIVASTIVTTIVSQFKVGFSSGRPSVWAGAPLVTGLYKPLPLKVCNG